VIDKIIAQLKTGVIKDVIPFGSSATPASPYIVVKQDANPPNGVTYRIFVHMEKDQQIFLEDYIRNDLSILLNGFSSETRYGNYNEIETEQDFSSIIINNDDGTISMERSFSMATRLF